MKRPNKINDNFNAIEYYTHLEELNKYIDFLENKESKQFSLQGVVQSKRDETLKLLKEITIKIMEADKEKENGIYDPMLECAKNILNNYKIKRR